MKADEADEGLKPFRLTIWGSLDRLTQPEISFSVSLLTVLMVLIRGCLVTISPVTQGAS